MYLFMLYAFKYSIVQSSSSSILVMPNANSAALPGSGYSLPCSGLPNIETPLYYYYYYYYYGVDPFLIDLGSKYTAGFRRHRPTHIICLPPILLHSTLGTKIITEEIEIGNIEGYRRVLLF